MHTVHARGLQGPCAPASQGHGGTPRPGIEHAPHQDGHWPLAAIVLLVHHASLIVEGLPYTHSPTTRQQQQPHHLPPSAISLPLRSTHLPAHAMPAVRSTVHVLKHPEALRRACMHAWWRGPGTGAHARQQAGFPRAAPAAAQQPARSAEPLEWLPPAAASSEQSPREFLAEGARGSPRGSPRSGWRARCVVLRC